MFDPGNLSFRKLTCFLFISLVSGLFLPSCASHRLLTRNDYRPAVEALKKDGPSEALRQFPSGEAGAFIPLMEKTYLNLLQGKAEIDALQAYAVRIDERLKYRVSRELEFLFYVETPEGYYASEHEIIWMHMLLSWGYSLRGDYDSAAIEAKKSAVLLEGKSREGRFDDPMLRVILGVLWAMCDRWEDARVDFRVAARQDPTLKWAATLSNLEEPPEQLALFLTGVGPEPYWKPEMQWNPVRGLRDLEFRADPDTGNLLVYDAKGRWLPVHASPDSAHWYKRHMERDNQIHNLIDDSHYGELVLYSATKGGIKSGLGITAGVVVAALGIGVGGAIAYYGQSQGAFELGAVIAYVGIRWGYSIGTETVKSSYETAMEELDLSDRYRYVRFMPTRARVVFGSGARPFKVVAGGTVTSVETNATNGNRISIQYIRLP